MIYFTCKNSSGIFYKKKNTSKDTTSEIKSNKQEKKNEIDIELGDLKSSQDEEPFKEESRKEDIEEEKIRKTKLGEIIKLI